MPRSLKPLARLPFAALFFALLASALLLRAQSPAPTPQSSTPTIKANARIVVLDVVVTDKNQKPVHNLKPSDFTVLEANAPQTIKNFEEHIAPSAAQAANLPQRPKLPPGLFTNYTPAPSGTLNVILFDVLNTPMKDQAYVQSQLLQYIKNAPRGVPMAIFGLNNQLVMLQGFTSDPDLLKYALEHKTLPGSSDKILDPLAGNGNPNSAADALNNMSGADDIGVLISNIQNFEAEQASTLIQQRTSITLDAMNAIAHYLSIFPGRKNLIWFSASFPLSILPDGSGINHPFDVVINSEDEFRETANLLAAARVAVYPIDARGVTNIIGENASDAGGKFANTRANMNQQMKASTQNNEEHGTMNQMADTTGGHAFVDTNGLADGVAKAVEQGSNYYTLTYSPTDPKSDGSFRKIQLQLQQKGLTLDYRHGYYTETPQIRHALRESIRHHTAAVVAANVTKTMDLAMLHTVAPTPLRSSSRRAYFPPPLPQKTLWRPATHRTPSSKNPSKAPIAATSSTSQPIRATSPSPAQPTASTPATSR